ncbi:hypothetical protein VNO77_35119 [Canavalia gladiata]|uniref:Uncharacterized protein n=1 Tax=Canavalia gladiata TaxID=3824 RepID=A0AAN9KEC4_CANGL
MRLAASNTTQGLDLLVSISVVVVCIVIVHRGEYMLHLISYEPSAKRAMIRVAKAGWKQGEMSFKPHDLPCRDCGLPYARNSLRLSIETLFMQRFGGTLHRSFI